MSRPKARKVDSKTLIIERATDLFYRHGFVKASIRDIVRAVGVTNSTVYIHFKNKDDILYHIIDDMGSLLLRELSRVMEEYADPVECLRQMILRQVSLIKENRREIKIYMEEHYQLPTDLRKRALKQHRQVYEIYYRKILEIQEKGLIRDLNPTVMTFGLFAMINWAHRWFRESGVLSIEKVADEIVEIFFSGIFKAGGHPS
jgi:AcrR family transcriptional regulator